MLVWILDEKIYSKNIYVLSEEFNFSQKPCKLSGKLSSDRTVSGSQLQLVQIDACGVVPDTVAWSLPGMTAKRRLLAAL
jgi:hypothetical protein